MSADAANARCDALLHAAIADHARVAQCSRLRAGMRRDGVTAPASARLFDHAAMLHARLPEANFTSVAQTLNAHA